MVEHKFTTDYDVGDSISKIEFENDIYRVGTYKIAHISFDKYSIGWYATYHLENRETVPHYLATLWGDKEELQIRVDEMNKKQLVKKEN